jgi:MFS transporter, DHA1 family, multidrug resistance protein
MGHTSNPEHQLPRLQHGLIAFPSRVWPWIEPWFLVYACLGIVQDGLLPLLLPLSAGGAAHAGAIVGVMNLAGLTSPFWGHFADRRRLHRQVLLAGILVVIVPLLLMPAHLGLSLQIALVGLLGVGFAAANTVANIFIIGVRPQHEWDARIGALQLLMGLGEVVGLLLAGLIGGRHALAFGVSAALVASALPIALMTLRCVKIPISRVAVVAHSPVGGQSCTGSPQRHFHLPTWSGLKNLLCELEMPFARLSIVWFVSYLAMSAVLTMFPLALVQAFAASDGLPATAYAFASAASLVIFPWAVSIAERHGEWVVLRAGFVVRAIAMAILAAAFLAQISGKPLGLTGFVLLVMAWPLLGVSSTALVAQNAPGEKGEALGVFNASSSVAAALGAFLGGWGMEMTDYGTICAVSAVIVAIATLLSYGRNEIYQPLKS